MSSLQTKVLSFNCVRIEAGAPQKLLLETLFFFKFILLVYYKELYLMPIILLMICLYFRLPNLQMLSFSALDSDL